MSLKEDIAVVKEEISTEEQFLTSFIKIEKFVKKYKNMFFALVAVVLIGVVGYIGYDLYEQDRLSKANAALVALIQNPTDKASLDMLQAKSPKLYEAYVFANAMAKNDKDGLQKLSSAQNQVFADLARYQHAAGSSNENELRSYASSKEPILKDFANFLLAQKAIDKNDTKAASEFLSKIPVGSNLKEQASYLEHLLIKNKTK